MLSQITSSTANSRRAARLVAEICWLVTILMISNHTLSGFSLDPLQETRCLSCIRNVSSLLSGVDTTKRCEGYLCGQYQISYSYWAESGKPGTSQGSRDYQKCARDRNCSEQAVRAYFKKFKRDCNGDSQIDCLDMAALHKGGPTSCSKDWFYTSRYWLAFNKTSCVTQRNSPLDPSGENLLADGQTAEIGATALRGPQSQPVMKNQSLSTECLDCICDAVSGCNTSVNNCNSGTVCGPFAISQAYWKDGRKPGASWTACARTRDCSSVTIKNYMEKHKRDCNDDGFITCEDYAAIHKRGPRSCSIRLLEQQKDHYWNKFQACRANQKPVKDVNMVKVGNESNDELPSTTQLVGLVSRSEPNPPLSSTTPASPPTAQPEPQTTTSNYVLQVAKSSHSSNYGGGGRFDYSQTPKYETTPVEEKSSSRLSTRKPVTSMDQLASNDHFQHHHLHRHRITTTQIPNVVSDKQSDVATEKKSDSDQAPSRAPLATKITLPKLASFTSANSWTTVAQSQQPATTKSSTTTTTPAPVQQTNLRTTNQQHHMTTTLFSPPPQTTATTTVTLDSFVRQREKLPPPPPIIEAPSLPDHMLPLEISQIRNEHSKHHGARATTSGTSLVSNQPVVAIVAETISAEELDQKQVTGFDKAVINLVGNPEFTRTHPPVPAEFAATHKESQVTADFSSPEINEELQGGSLYQKVLTTNHVKNPNSKRDSATRDANQVTTDQWGSPITKSRVSNSPQQQPSYPMTTTTATDGNLAPVYQRSTSLAQQQQQPSTVWPQQPVVDLADKNKLPAMPTELPILGPLIGNDSMSLASLFDKGLNESSRIASECLECICDASSNCDSAVQCISKQREKNRCGLYMISWNQYEESDIALTSLAAVPQGMSEEAANEKMYYDCTTDRVCAEKLIHLYIEKHQKDCNNDGKIDCYDIAAIHRVGPDNCNSGKFLSSQYWKDFYNCYANDRLTTVDQSPAAS